MKKRVFLLPLCFLIVSRPGFSQEKPNVVFITVDTLRPDYLGAYGYPGQTSPNIDAFSKDTLRFTNAFTPIPLTTPSHASIFSSFYPIKHGVFTNSEKVSSEEKMLAEILRHDAYQTAAFVSASVVGKKTGINRGFDIFDEVPARVQSKTPQIGVGSWKSFRGILERKAADTADAALMWLEKDRDKNRPFFMWAHFYDAHFPYLPPAEYVKGIPVEESKWDKLNELLKLNDLKVVLDREDHDLINALYDGEIRYADHQVGRVFSYLKDNGLYDGAVIVVMSDHGETLGEKEDYYGHHNYVYDQSISIPLMIKFPGISPNVVHAKTFSMDVMPSLLAYLKIKDPNKAQRDGRSILPTLTGGWNKKSKPLYISTYYDIGKAGRNSRSLDDPRYKAPGKTSKKEYMDQGIRTDHWKYWKTNDPRGRDEFLFDLKTDPKETKNVVDDFREKADELKRLLSPYESAAEKGRSLAQRSAPKGAEHGEKVKELKSLGYL